MCSSCGAVVQEHAPWPDWHGHPQSEDPAQAGWPRHEAGEDDAPAAFEALALDPDLVDVHPGRPGQRWWVVGLVISGLVWVLVGLPYEVGDPARWWDIVWFAAAALTGVLAVRLVVYGILRTRTHGFRSALRWLVS